MIPVHDSIRQDMQQKRQVYGIVCTLVVKDFLHSALYKVLPPTSLPRSSFFFRLIFFRYPEYDTACMC